MDALTRMKLQTTIEDVMVESIEQAKYFLKKRKPDIAIQYTTLAERVRKAETLKEAKMFEVILMSLNNINDIIENN